MRYRVPQRPYVNDGNFARPYSFDPKSTVARLKLTAIFFLRNIN